MLGRAFGNCLLIVCCFFWDLRVEPVFAYELIDISNFCHMEASWIWNSHRFTGEISCEPDIYFKRIYTHGSPKLLYQLYWLKVVEVTTISVGSSCSWSVPCIHQPSSTINFTTCMWNIQGVTPTVALDFKNSKESSPASGGCNQSVP